MRLTPKELNDALKMAVALEKEGRTKESRLVMRLIEHAECLILLGEICGPALAKKRKGPTK